MRHISASLLLLTLFAAAPALAQVRSRPTDAPIVTADNESWYIAREPIQFAGDVYYPAGAAVFFNGNTMARAGHYNGVPLYSDTTIEPYSVVYVPVSRGLMQPYERLRDGALAGTTGSRAPSFPVSVSAMSARPPEAAIPPPGLPVPIGAVSAYTPEGLGATSESSSVLTAIGTSGIVAAPIRRTPERTAVVSAIPPQTNDGLWVSYLGEKWVSAGAAVPLAPADFRPVGNYEGFPVFTRQGMTDQVIYLPAREGLVAPYRLKPTH
jgi:hypothetical protein